MKRFRLTYHGARAISAGAGSGVMLQPGVPRNVSHTTATAFARRYPDETMIVDEATAMIVHQGRLVPDLGPPRVAETVLSPVPADEPELVSEPVAPEVTPEPEPVEETAADEPLEEIPVLEADVFDFVDAEDVEVAEVDNSAVLDLIDAVAPKLSADSRAQLLGLIVAGGYTVDSLSQVSGIGKATAKKLLEVLEG